MVQKVCCRRENRLKIPLGPVTCSIRIAFYSNVTPLLIHWTSSIYCSLAICLCLANIDESKSARDVKLKTSVLDVVFHHNILYSFV